MGFRFRSTFHPSPSEWDPYTDSLDYCIHTDTEVEEVSMTPDPQLPTSVTTVR
jgi:hypothetical protein